MTLRYTWTKCTCRDSPGITYKWMSLQVLHKHNKGTLGIYTRYGIQTHKLSTCSYTFI